MSRPTVLVVDDKPNMLRLMAKVLSQDAVVLTAESGTLAVARLTETPVDAVLCDLKMPDMDGLEVLKAVKRLRPTAQFVLMTAYATVDTAIEALRLGAYDYLTKPFEPEAARAVLKKALTRAAVRPAEPPPGAELLPGILGASPPMLALTELIRRFADSEATVLILGETGTGKERVARALHELSPRSSKRFVALNCAALPAELLESELFGHARGAFTGAVGERKGLFEEADGGTLFLDEIGDLKSALQAKLTRVLEERAIRRLGEAKERPVNVRLLAATHRDLMAMVKAGTFREDLWYRLDVARVELPPLRARGQDVALLAHHFLAQQAERTRSLPLTGFSPAALARVSAFDWPGNVRQLRAAVERACLVARGAQIEVEDLPAELALAGHLPAPEEASGTWAEAQERGRVEAGRRYLEAVLRRFNGQVTEAAAHAGVERESFYRLLRRHGVEPSGFRRE